MPRALRRRRGLPRGFGGRDAELGFCSEALQRECPGRRSSPGERAARPWLGRERARQADGRFGRFVARGTGKGGRVEREDLGMTLNSLA